MYWVEQFFVPADHVVERDEWFVQGKLTEIDGQRENESHYGIEMESYSGTGKETAPHDENDGSRLAYGNPYESAYDRDRDHCVNHANDHGMGGL